MPLAKANIGFFKSSNPGSSGGAITTFPIQDSGLNNLFTDAQPADLANGNVIYYKIFLLNSDALITLNSAVLWFILQPTDDEQLAVGLGGPADTDGTVISYVSPSAEVSGLALGNIAPGGSVAIWIRRTILKGTPQFQSSAFFQLGLQGVASSDLSVFTKLFTYIWNMVSPPTPESEMGAFAYDTQIQITDDNGNVVTQEENSQSVPLPSNTSSDQKIELQANQIDQPIPMVASTVDIVYVKGDPNNEVTVKFGSTAATAFTIRPGGSVGPLDVKNVAQIYATNVNAQPAQIRVIMAVRQS